MNFTTNNQENFRTNSFTHNINTRNKHHLHSPNANLSCIQKGTLYAGINIFNIYLVMTILKIGQNLNLLEENTLIHAPFTVYINNLCVKIIYNNLL